MEIPSDDDLANLKKGTRTAAPVEKHSKRDARKVDEKHSKPVHKSSRSSKDVKVQSHKKKGSPTIWCARIFLQQTDEGCK